MHALHWLGTPRQVWVSRIIRQSNRNWLKRYSNPIYPKNAISIFKDWSMKRSNPSFVAENCQTFFCFELKQNWNWIECIKKNKRKCSLAMSSLASWICQIYQIPKKDRGFYGLLNLSKFIKYQRRREYFAVCWICPILNQYQRRIPGKVYFLLRIHEPQDTPVQSHKCKDFESSGTASHTTPPRMLKGLKKLKAKEGIPCLVDIVTGAGIFSSFRRKHQSNVNLSTKALCLETVHFLQRLNFMQVMRHWFQLSGFGLVL